MAKARATRKATPRTVASVMYPESEEPIVAKNVIVAVNVKLLSSAAKLPLYATVNSAGADLYSTERVVIPSQGHALVGTGLMVEIPDGYEMQIRPRSGLALQGITIPNAPGTVDSDYRGEVMVILRNLSAFAFTVEPGMRIAQAIIAPVVKAQFLEVQELTDTERGVGGFGSTGR